MKIAAALLQQWHRENPARTLCCCPHCGGTQFKDHHAYDTLLTELRQAPVLHCDETSWWVVGPGWWLWVFTTKLLTFYVVAQSRGRDLLYDILGNGFGGVHSQRLSGDL